MTDEIRKMLRESGIDPDAKARELEELACAVADAYQALENAGNGVETDRRRVVLAGLLRQLEAATRGSAMRRVK